jgi:hypothetical protein
MQSPKLDWQAGAVREWARIRAEWPNGEMHDYSIMVTH